MCKKKRMNMSYSLEFPLSTRNERGGEREKNHLFSRFVFYEKT
jgi:hypothetical protein